VAAYIGDRWDRLCHVLGRPDLIADSRFATSRLRTANRPTLRLELGDRFRSQSTAHWLDALRAEDILCAKVANYEDLMAHPQLHANGIMTQVDVPGHGGVRMPGFPINSLAENGLPHRPAPTLGQHTRDVLRACAVKDDEIDALIARGAAR
jgi:crotonobetainyl-CoA:carnitine CoA-transferase CaiB-like acyl-CoA transferase